MGTELISLPTWRAGYRMSNKIKVAVLGTGNIGTDLAERILLDPGFELVSLVGRRKDSPGLLRFEGRVKNLIHEGIDGLLELTEDFHGVFDATSAFDHLSHWEKLNARGKWAIDLTPSRLGLPFVPVLANRVPSMKIQKNSSANYSMVTCGGQSSAPMLFALAAAARNIKEVEVSSSIAALSAGPATRRNIDQYVQSTEDLIINITGCNNVKAILVLNPAEPPVMMRTTVQMRVGSFDQEFAVETLNQISATVSSYVPGYQVVVKPLMRDDFVVTATAKVTGAGYFLPEYAGNLDIINAAAVETARLHVSEIMR